MTQDDVDLVYDYLHENYRYEDGQLIVKKDIKHSKRVGDVLGGFFYQGTMGSPKMRGSITVKRKDYRMPLSHFIWIYHHKEPIKYIHHKDLNPVNNKIENLIPSTLTAFQSMRSKPCKGYVEKNNKDGSKSYRVKIDYLYKKINIGSFKCKETAEQIYIKARELVTQGVCDPIQLKEKIASLFPNEKIKIIKNKFGMGVYKNENNFVARIQVNKKSINIGYFDTPQEAHEAYVKYKEELRK